MASSNYMVLTPILLAVVAFLSIPCLGDLAPTQEKDIIVVPKYTVHVVNGLSGQHVLFIHCKSKDDDLGERNITAGAEFNWTFRSNFWRTTLFWCYMRTGLKHATFVVFREKLVFGPQKPSKCQGGNCIWTAKDDGIYLKNIPFNRDEFVHKWE